MAAGSSIGEGKPVIPLRRFADRHRQADQQVYSRSGEAGGQAAGRRCAPAGIKVGRGRKYLEAQYPVQIGVGTGRSASTGIDGGPSADGTGEDRSAAVSGSDVTASVGSAGGAGRSGGSSVAHNT